MWPYKWWVIWVRSNFLIHRPIAFDQHVRIFESFLSPSHFGGQFSQYWWQAISEHYVLTNITKPPCYFYTYNCLQRITFLKIPKKLLVNNKEPQLARTARIRVNNFEATPDIYRVCLQGLNSLRSKVHPR